MVELDQQEDLFNQVVTLHLPVSFLQAAVAVEAAQVLVLTDNQEDRVVADIMGHQVLEHLVKVIREEAVQAVAVAGLVVPE
jgi:hypothetical protein